MTTDQNWQHDFTAKQSKYTDRVLYHSKAGYLKIGNEEVFCPWSLEMGLEMVSLFGGTSYLSDGHGGMQKIENGKGLRAYWHAFLPGGADNGETTYQNVQGDQLGSWVMRLNYDGDWSGFSLYADKSSKTIQPCFSSTMTAMARVASGWRRSSVAICSTTSKTGC